MTWFQIVACCILAPYAFMNILHLVMVLAKKKASTYDFKDSVQLAIAVVVLVVAFVGVK